MAKKEITVTFKTITPLCTGDAWQNNSEIRPSSLIGSLRFWFSFYWKVEKNGNTEKLDKDGIPKENLSEFEKPEIGKTFKEILKNKILKTDNFDEALDKTLYELGLSVPSRIFGCTGWKSRVKIKIEDFEEEYINFDNLEFEFPLNKIQQNGQTKKSSNTKFWVKKILFKDNISNPLKLFKNVKIKLITTDYWWDKYFEQFFEYFKDKLILVGGKNSFGFGFVNLFLDKNQNELSTFNSIDNKLKVDQIIDISYPRDKQVIGFNFKFYLRNRENKNFRIKNFGAEKIASKIYVSNLFGDNSIYLLLLNNPFLNESEIPENVFNKYKNNWLNELSNISNTGENNG